MTYTIHNGDALDVLRTLPDESVQCVVTSPPYYGLRDYKTGRWEGGDLTCDHVAPPTGGRTGSTLEGAKQRGGHSADGQYRNACAKCGAVRTDDQLGLEPTPDAYVARLVDVFREVRRVLRDSGTLWCNLGDSYGSGKQLLGIPWRVAFALQADSWYLRADVIWHKPNPMPESVTDRPTKAHEYVFLLTKSARYFYDAQAVSEKAVAADFVTRYRNVRSGKSPNNKDRNDAATNMTGGFMSDDPTTRNRRSVWTISTRPYSGAHFATMPPELARVCVLAGSRPGDTVLDPFAGSGTTGMVALENGREFVGIELNAEYISLAHQRIAPAQAKRAAMLPFHEVTQ